MRYMYFYQIQNIYTLYGSRDCKAAQTEFKRNEIQLRFVFVNIRG